MRDRRPPPPEPYDASKDDEYTNRELEALADQMLRDGAKAINPDTGKERGIGGKDPILFAEHEYSRKRREIYVEAGIPDPSIVSGMYNRCVDDQTEALTPAGWRRFDQLAIGDLIWSYDLQLDACRWEPLTDLFVNGEFRGRVDVLESRMISARTTEGHRWAVVHERSKDTRIEVTELHPRHYIPLGRPPVDQDAGYSDLMELLGWVITDGTYHKGKASAVVYQSIHNAKLPALRRCLAANDLNTEYEYIDKNDVARWRVPAATGHQLRAKAPVKLFSSLTLTDFSYAEREALLRGAIYGDGTTKHQNPQDFIEITSTVKSEADALQGLVTVQGHTSNLRTVRNDAAFCPVEHYVSLKRTGFAYVRAAMQESEWFEGTVWCPSIATGFWMARRNHKTYITGNTHPQGRKVNTPEQRRVNGASWYR